MLRLWSFNDDDERGARSISRFFLVCPSCHAEAFETLDAAGPYRAIYQLLDTFCWGHTTTTRVSLLGSLNIYSEHLTSCLCMHESPGIIIISLSCFSSIRLYPFTLVAGLLLPLHLSIYPTSQSSQAQIFNPPRLVSRRDGSTERSHSNPIPDLFIMIKTQSTAASAHHPTPLRPSLYGTLGPLSLYASRIRLHTLYTIVDYPSFM